jgi:hypothetical protein
MGKRDAVKKGHEKAVTDQLLECEKVDATFEKAGDPDKQEPDVVYLIEGRKIGIEVATAYYDETDAKDEWEIAAGERPLAPGEIRPSSLDILVGPDQMICEAVQAELEDKCSKAYAGVDETWLCINMVSGLSDAESVAECVKELKLLAAHKFSRIYLTYTAPDHEGGKYIAIRIS